MSTPDAVAQAPVLRCQCMNWCGDDPALVGGQVPPCPLRVAALKARRMRDAAQLLLTELEHAHRLIPLMLAEMSTAAQTRFAKASEHAGIGTDGAIRHHERAAALTAARCAPEGD